VFEVDNNTKKELVENFDRFKTLKHSTAKPKAFTEKGLYMLATILTSKKAIQVSISIIETFTKIRELSRTIKKLPSVTDKKEQQSLMQKSGEIIAEILYDGLDTDESETTIEMNLAFFKFKHTIKKSKK
jgi:phage regulator Rha-like protein